MVRIWWHSQTKQVEYRVDLYHDSDRDEESHIESKQTSQTIMFRIIWYSQTKHVENRVDLYHDMERDERGILKVNIINNFLLKLNDTYSLNK